MGINICQGICTSQLDDYCGMFMDGEECPACKAAWESAHAENDELRKTKRRQEIAQLGLPRYSCKRPLTEESK